MRRWRKKNNIFILETSDQDMSSFICNQWVTNIFFTRDKVTNHPSQKRTHGREQEINKQQKLKIKMLRLEREKTKVA